MAAIRRDVAMCERATNYSADMTVWQYAQLTVTVERRPPQGDTWTALWHGPGLNDSEDYSQSGQTVLELLNQFGADGWELAGIQNHNDGEAGSSRGGAHRLITVYTFKRLHTSTSTKSAHPVQEVEGRLRSQQPGLGQPARSKDDELPEWEMAGSATLGHLTVYWLWDGELEASTADGHSLHLTNGVLMIERRAVRLPSRDDLGKIEASWKEYEDSETSQGRREEIKKAASDYAATWMENQWGHTWWKTSSSFSFSEAADVLNSSADWLRSLVEHPLADIASAAGAQGPVVSLSAGITTRFVTEPVTAPLEAAAQICEVAGIVIGMTVGAHPLVMACAKLFAHDALNDVLAEGFEQIADSIEQIFHPADVDRQPTGAETRRPAADARQLTRLKELGQIILKDDPDTTTRQAPTPGQVLRPASSGPVRPYPKSPPPPDPNPRHTPIDPTDDLGPQPPSPGQALPPPI